MKLSIVDLSPIGPQDTRHEAFQNSLALAQHAERLGFARIWFAEHHGGRIGAGRAPEVLIAAAAAHTERIKVGSGGVLLNHYSPFKVAELFCTLNELYPGRIDLGVGRATAGPVADLALQQDRSKPFRADSDGQIAELVAWLEDGFPPEHPFAKHPILTLDSLPTLYLLGSSGWSAQTAALLGLRYVFAGFINQQQAPHILQAYHRNFTPAAGAVRVARPEAMLAVHAVCADTEEEARRQLAPVHVMYQNLARGDVGAPLMSPEKAVSALGGLPPLERYVQGSGVPPRFVGGTVEQVGEQLQAMARDLAVEEIMIQDLIVEFDARLRSYELLSTLIEGK